MAWSRNTCRPAIWPEFNCWPIPASFVRGPAFPINRYTQIVQPPVAIGRPGTVSSEFGQLYGFPVVPDAQWGESSSNPLADFRQAYRRVMEGVGARRMTMPLWHLQPEAASTATPEFRSAAERLVNGDKPTIPAVAPLVRTYKESGPAADRTVGGSLHVVLEDGNVEDHSVEGCIPWAEERKDEMGVLLARVLLRHVAHAAEEVGGAVLIPGGAVCDHKFADITCIEDVARGVRRAFCVLCDEVREYGCHPECGPVELPFLPQIPEKENQCR